MTDRAVEPLTEAEREALVLAARAYIGVRWQHQGRTARGLDCAGLVMVALRSLGRKPVDSIGYPRRPYRNMLEATVQLNFGAPLPAGTALRQGDVVVMHCEKTAPNHVGIIGEHRGNLTLIHAYAPDKQVVEMLLDDTWRKRIIGVHR